MKYDVVYYPHYTTIEPHFCRDYDCFGSNEEHGYTLEEACLEVAQWYLEQAERWLNQSHPDIQFYLNQIGNNHE